MIHLVSLNPALDLTLDLEKPGQGKIGKVKDFSVQAGGKALNLARFLRSAKVSSMVWLGTGGGSHPTHRLYRDLLTQEKLKVRFLSKEAPIRFNAVLSNKKGTAKFNHEGFEANYTGFKDLLKSVKKGDCLVLTGRLPHGDNELLYASWVDLFQRRGAKVIVDTSGIPLMLALLAKPWFFKVNRFEFSEGLSRRFSNLAQVLSFVKANGVKKALRQGAVTDGAHGAIVWNYPEGYWLSSKDKTKRFVVGAGDGFLAGYLYGLAKRKSLKGSALWAGAFGATVAEWGIQGFTLARAKQVLKRIKVKKVL